MTKNSITFEELTIHYLKHSQKYHSPTTYHNNVLLINQLNKDIGKLQANKMDARVIQKYVDILGERKTTTNNTPLAHSTILKKYKTIQAILNFGVNYSYITINRVRNVRIPYPKANVENEILNAEEIANILSQMKVNFLDIYIPTLLCVELGLRRSEALGLTWNSINYNNKTLTINKTMLNIKGKPTLINNTKTQSSKRVLPLSDFLISQLKEHEIYTKKFHKDLICISPVIGTQITPQVLTREFIKFNESINGKHVRLHDLRHSFSQLLQDNEIDITTISKLMGHSAQYVTQNIYSKLSKIKGQNAIDQISEIININNQ